MNVSATDLSAVSGAVRALPQSRRQTIDLLASEWTKLRSVRSTYWTLLAAAVVTIGLSAIVAAVYVAQFDHLSATTKADFDAASFTMTGGILAQLAIAVLGVLVITNEYASGMIRSTFAAVPRRLHVLAAKATVFAGVTLGVALASCFAAFFIGQAILSSKGVGVSLGAPDALRTVVGTALYLTVLGLIALAIGALIRKTAGAITAVVGLIFVLPAFAGLLPDSMSVVEKLLPGTAGQAIITGSHNNGSPTLAPWVGMGVFCLYAVVALAAAGFLLVRRDA